MRRWVVPGVLAALWPVAAVNAADSCPAPPLRTMPPGDAAADARGRGQLFESIEVPGFTDLTDGTAGLAAADFDRDGRVDLLTVHDATRRMRLFLNQGCFSFQEHPLQIQADGFDAADLGHSANIPNVVDFNGDGFPDIYLSRGRGAVEDPSPGNNLLLSQGRFDVFVDRGGALGVTNRDASSRQSSIGDVNGDGYLDIAVGADNIGNTRTGLPVQRLYIYRPPPAGGDFEQGHFEDIGGTAVIPGFGGPFACDPDVDRAGPGITLRDLDNDGDLDLLQTYHADMNHERWDDTCAAGEYRQGVYVWRNLLRETGAFVFERVQDNGLAEEGRMRYDPALGYYLPEAVSTGLPYANTADVDNDGLLDVIAVGPTDPAWHVNAQMIAGRFWRNLGDFLFTESTEANGLAALNWTYGDWQRFWRTRLTKEPVIGRAACAISNQRPLCEDLTTQDHQFYAGDTVFGDFNNDGWLDLVLVDRHELDGNWGSLRNMLFMNRGDGTFTPVPTTLSGLDSNSIAAEAADLDGDGLLDLVFIADPKNSYNLPKPPLPEDRFTNKVYWNTGAFGAADNHWLEVRLAGRPARELVGAKVYAYEPAAAAQPRLLGSRHLFSNDSYKSGHALTAHFGLGTLETADIYVVLPNGAAYWFRNQPADRRAELTVE